MTLPRSALIVFILFVTAVAGPFASADSHSFTAKELSQGYREGRLLAKPKAASIAADLTRHESQQGVTLERELPRLSRLRILRLAPSADTKTTLGNLRASGLYEYVEPDYIRHSHLVPNDTRFGEQWALQNSGQSSGKSGADIKAVPAWDILNDASGIIVAVIDTGIRQTHEDLAANLWQNPAPNSSTDYLNALHGINTLVAKGSTDSGNPEDDEGHGTSVASVIAAVSNNGKGMAGVAWKAQIMSLKSGNSDGQSAVSDTVTCIDYAIAHGAKIMNASFGSSSYSQTEYDAIKRARDAGVILVASAGNDSAENQIASEYPASYALENIVAVANSDRNDQLASSSTYGALVELAAPGTDILSCAKDSDTSYRTISGTSLSAPMVSGALALVAAKFPGETYRSWINRVLRSVDSLPALSGKVQTGGRLNLQKALSSTTGRPFNDDFSTASVLTGDAISTRGVSVGATAEAGEPTPSGAAGASLWWSWTPTVSGSAVADTTGSGFSNIISVYTGSAVNALASVGTADSATGRVTFPVTAGTTYHIMVDGKSAGATGEVVMNVGTTPPNDNFSSASSLSGSSAQITGTVRLAGKESGEPTLSGTYGNGTGHTVWYKWTATKTSDFTIAVYTQSFSPIVGVYTGSSVGALTKVSVDDVVTSFSATAGTVYYIVVDSETSTTGSFTLSLLEATFGFYMGDQVNSSPAALNGAYIAIDQSGAALYLSSNGTDGSYDVPVTGVADVNTPAFLPDGTFLVTSSNGLFRIKSDLTVVWKKSFGTDVGVSSSPSVAADGTIYVHSDDGKLHALASDSTEHWAAAVPGVSYSSPSIASDGTIYLGSDDNNLYAINPTDGSIKWKFDASDQIYSSPAIDTDGTIYFGTLGSKFFAVTPAGVQKWAYTVGGEVSSSPAIGADGTIYFGSYDNKLYALTSAGALKWSAATGDEIRASSPAVASDGSIYIGSYDKNMYQISAAGAVVQKFPSGAAIRSSPLIDLGNVMWGSGDANFYATFPSLNAASSPWPMHRGSAARTGRRMLTTAPVINTQPSNHVVAIGGSTTLTVNADGKDTLTFQWYFNGAAIAGATQSTYTITNASAANAGNYTVVVTNSLGSVTSSVATVTVAAASDLGHIVNLSARAVAGSGSQTLTVGFILSGGSGTKPLLIRGVGPSLAKYGVAGFLGDPSLQVFSGQTVVASNDDWGTDSQVPSISHQVNAFDFSSSKDAALVVNLPADGTVGYTAQVTAGTGSTATSGVCLAEFYDASPVYTAGTPRLTNISARAQVGTADNVLIVGFIVSGSTPVKVLVRGSGPGLTSYGVSGVLADPQIKLTQLDGTVLQQNDNWGSNADLAGLQSATSQVNAFAFAAGSKDAALIATLPPGGYTAIISGVNNTTGVALAEIFEVQ